jgi:hypothetical protein
MGGSARSVYPGAAQDYRQYSVRLSGAGVRDAAGNGLGDSTFVFRTSTADTLSEIAGTVRQVEDSAEAGAFVIRASQVENKDVVAASTVPFPGPYRIPHCLPEIRAGLLPDLGGTDAIRSDAFSIQTFRAGRRIGYGEGACALAECKE